jgi:hypothetical protein
MAIGTIFKVYCPDILCPEGKMLGTIDEYSTIVGPNPGPIALTDH